MRIIARNQELGSADQFKYLGSLATQDVCRAKETTKSTFTEKRSLFEKRFEFGVEKEAGKILYLEHYSLWVRNMSTKKNIKEIFRDLLNVVAGKGWEM